MTAAVVKSFNAEIILLIDSQNRLALFHPEKLESELIDNSDIIAYLKKKKFGETNGVRVYYGEEKIVDVFTFEINRI